MKKSIIKFEKDNCNPCDSVGNYLNQKGAVFQSVNAFNNPDMAKAYRIKTVPTVILLEDGAEIKRSIGFNPKELDELLILEGSQV